MKITDPQVIKQGEQDLIASVQEDLDLDAVREILKERMSVAALSSKGGQIVVHNNQIAFRLDFEINLSGSLLFDRDGTFIDQAPDQEDPSEFAAPLVRDREDGMILDEDLDDDDLMDHDIPETGMDIEAEEEDLSVDLPDYGLDDGPEDLHLEDAAQEEDGLDIDGELELAAEELALDDMEEEDTGFLEDEEIELEDEEAEEAFQGMMDDDEENPFGDDDIDGQDLDDDINDILKESREFWEQKKES